MQSYIFKMITNFITYITHVDFFLLKRYLSNQRFWIKLIIWQKIVKVAKVLR
jgi:hypothetical protein